VKSFVPARLIHGVAYLHTKSLANMRISKMRCLDGHYLILYREEFENTKRTDNGQKDNNIHIKQNIHIKVQSMSPTGTKDFTLRTHVDNNVIEHGRHNPFIRLYSIVFHV
jgi:hypothetical protein